MASGARGDLGGYALRVAGRQAVFILGVLVVLTLVSFVMARAGSVGDVEFVYSLLYLPFVFLFWNLFQGPVSVCVAGILWWLRRRPAAPLRRAAVLAMVGATAIEWGILWLVLTDRSAPELNLVSVLWLASVLLFALWFPLPEA